MKPLQNASHAAPRRASRLWAQGGMLAVILGAAALLAGGHSTPPAAVAGQSDFAGLVDIGSGRRLYLECRGQGSPTVVLENGYRGSALWWTDDFRTPRSPRTMVMPAVASFARVCAYDRPGTVAGVYGDDNDVRLSRSDAVPQPRTAPEMVADLHALLQAAAVPGPYVLAGQSLGGLLARLYASSYPDEVVGMVLIDAFSERLETLMTPTQWQGLVRLNREGGSDIVQPIPGYGDLETVPYAAPFPAVRKAVAASPLRPMPLAVLGHGVPFEIAAPPEGFTSAEEVEAILQAANADLATLAPRARFTVAGKSGHDIHQDQPELVTEAIRQVVEGVRHPDTWYDLVSCCAAAGATTTPQTTARSSGLKPIEPAALQATVEKSAREMLVPGAMVLLRTPQGEFTINSGTTELGATIPPRADTYFRIASNTKTMTAAVILQLAQENKLRLSDPVSRYVPGVPNGDAITIAELLEMRSGLYNYTSAPELATGLDHEPTRVWTPDEVLAIAFARPPNFPPGTAFEYSNTNYALLGLIAEQVDRRPLAQAMRERLFGPLGLQHTLLPARDLNTIPAPYAHGYLYGSTSFALVDEPYPPEVQAAGRAGTLQPTDYTDLNPSFAEAAGGVISTASDLATWIEALVGGRVLDTATQRRWLNSLQPEDPSNPAGQQYGYGIAQLRWASNAVYFHGGETAGYNSFIGHDPTNQVTLVIWTNLPVSLEGHTTANALMVKVLDQIYVDSPLAPSSSPADTR
jgi:D-alanyl-D-alanine carboxypeptidase